MLITGNIIYGTAWKQERTAALVVSAVQHGFRAIDTACQLKHYREDLVGQALHDLISSGSVEREDIFLQTKYTPIGGQDLDKPLPYNPRDPVKKQVESSLQKSLENLKTTYLDSYLLHSPLKTMEYTLEAWRALMALQDEGKIRKIGVSNVYDVAIIHALSHERQVQVVQNRWYEGNQWDRRVFNYCREHQIQYQSFWTLTGSPSLLKHPTLLDLAKELKCTPAQAVYKLAQSEGIIPLSGTTDRVHMEEGVATHKIDFSNELVKSVKALIEGGIEV